jgi:hypothetical protein
MENSVFLDIMLCGSFMNQRFGGTYRLHHQGNRDVLGQVSSEYFGFACHSFITAFPLQQSPSIFHCWYNRSINGLRTSGLGSTPDS